MIESSRMPAVFVGHGNPMNAIEDNSYRQGWEALGRRLPRPTAVLCISAHWQTRGTQLTGAQNPQTIHDFYGFPQALYDVKYPAAGDPELARRCAALLAQANATLNPERGLDHGAWSVLLGMYPAADVPVVQLSLDIQGTGAHHYEIAKRLTPLRREGVLILGSGNIVHNLRLYDFYSDLPTPWALEFDLEVRQRIEARDHEALIAWPSLLPHAALAVPTPEHYLPLLYVLAQQSEGEGVSFFNTRVASSMSMTSLVIGG